MNGLMQDEQLLLIRLLERACALYPDQDVLTWTETGPVRISYEAIEHRVARLASALAGWKAGADTVVATFGHNTWRHLELCFAIPAMGATLVPMNPRFSDSQLLHVLQESAPAMVFADLEFLDRLAALRNLSGRHFTIVALGANSGLADHAYEELLESGTRGHAWPEFDERTACCLLYTSGTTGPPKGVLMSHRAVVLHTYVISQPCVHGIAASDVVLPVVPMYHAQAWGLPYAATLAGARQVYTGSAGARPDVVTSLIEAERVTLAAGVPTVWANVLAYLEERPADLSSLRRIPCGGAAVPGELIRAYRERHGVSVWQGYGMTETGPQAVFSGSNLVEVPPGPKASGEYLRQGVPVPGIRIRGVDSSGNAIPGDGVTSGELQIRGPWVASGYFAGAGAGAMTADGWLRTGDIVTLDSRLSIRIVDRAKDLIKSGGEWISSIELENALMAHPAIAEAAVVPMTDARWGERPAAFVCLAAGSSIETAGLAAWLREKFPVWWVPDLFEVVDEIPKTSVGKFDKARLRLLAQHNAALSASRSIDSAPAIQQAGQCDDATRSSPERTECED